jgi:hypothetical protein
MTGPWVSFRPRDVDHVVTQPKSIVMLHLITPILANGVYIGGGVLGLILVIVIVVFLLRRR